ncbi:F-box-like/WD repeat-containing protein TBL1XR1-A [Trichinella papuae]|uniref:F-box-like/WD repeat-containing protein TBL1XR1-A n=1 Tax=Trichinella papuae TaxID=268474 RepID=A0A0V1MCS4_9BILA|nr:F-box-like/WD repeat-containing protein TBL1XR1-A [Trichinella papuae]
MATDSSADEHNSKPDEDDDCSTPVSLLPPVPAEHLNFLVWKFFKDYGYHVTAELFAENNAVKENAGIEDLNICKGSLNKLLEMLHFKSVVDGDISQAGNLYDLVPGECFLSESSSCTTETSSFEHCQFYPEESFREVEVKYIMRTNYNYSICSLDWNLEDLLLTGSADKIVRLWNFEDKKEEAKHSCREMTSFGDENNDVNLPVSNGVILVSWSLQGDLIAAADSSGKLRIWKKDGSFIFNCLNVPENIVVMKWNVNGRQLLTATTDGIISIWSSSTGNCIARCTPFEDDITDADWKDDATFSACSKDGMLFHCCVTDANAKSPFKGHVNSINMIKWNSTGNMAATGSSDMMVKVWRFGNERCIGCLRGHTAEVNTLAWHSTDPAVLARAEILHMLHEHLASVRILAFRPASDMLISCSTDTVICLWNGRNGKRLRKIGNGYGATVNVIMWNRSGQRIAAGRQDGTLEVLEVKNF